MSQTKPDQARPKLREVSPPQASRFLAYNQISILRKAGFLFSIIAMGFLFQNCSGGGSGSGTGNGGGSASGPPPEISVNAFAGQTADELTITDDPDDWGSLEVSGKCDSKEHGQEVTVIAQGDEENRIEKKTRCNNPPDGSEADSDSHWRVTLERGDLDALQGKNMKALFTASIQSKKGVTGTSQPQALFVDSKFSPVEGTTQMFTILLEDIYIINGVCRLVVVANVQPVGTTSYSWYEGQTQLSLISIGSNLTLWPAPVNPLSYEDIRFPQNLASLNEPFINDLTVIVPETRTESKRYRVQVGLQQAITTKAYSHCKATTP